MSKFLQALAALLPTGFAWPRDPNSVLMRTLRGVAANYEALHNFTHATVARWQPQTTTRLAEWEAATGLPDPCFGGEQTDAQRLALVLERLRGIKLPYVDSSPSALGVIKALCESYGYTADVSYDEPFRVERNGICDRLGSPGVIFVDISSTCQPMRVDSAGVGDLLVACAPSDNRLLCVLERVVAARFALQIVVDGELLQPCVPAVPPPPPPPPPSDVCITLPNWSGLYADPEAVQPPNTSRETFDLANYQYVTSAIAHSTGIWYFEASLNRAIWDAFGDYPFSGIDLTDITPWPQAGWVSCADSTAQLNPGRKLLVYTQHASQEGGQPQPPAELATDAYVYLLDYFGAVDGFPGFTPLPGAEVAIADDSTSLGFAVNCDTGAWGMYLMDGTLYASGVQPALVGVKLLASIQAVAHNGDFGWHDEQELRLAEQDMRILTGPNFPMGAQAWSPEPVLTGLQSSFVMFASPDVPGEFEVNVNIAGADPLGDYEIQMQQGTVLFLNNLLNSDNRLSNPALPGQEFISSTYGLNSGQFPQLAGNEATLAGQTWRLVHVDSGRFTTAIVPNP